MFDLAKNLKNLLFIDIETVSAHSHFEQVSPAMQAFWRKKASYLYNPSELSEADFYFERAGIYAEFGKVIVIGLGFLHWNEQQELSLKVKTLYDPDEKVLLTQLKELLESKFNPKTLTLCAHNGKEFDFPYLCRRMLVNDVQIPLALQLSGRKPWEIPHLDTLEMWKFGDKKHYTSLDLLAALFGIPSSKVELSGELVNSTYHHEKDIDKIIRYCQEDVVVLAQLLLKYVSMPLVKEDNIERI